MKILGKKVSNKITPLYEDVERILSAEGISIVFKYSFEHPNPIFRKIRGIVATDPVNPTIKNVYVHDGLAIPELERVTAHELCHIIAASRAFGWRYAISGMPSKKQADIAESIAASINDCFTHIAVFQSMKDYGYNILGFDSCVIDDVRAYINQGRKWGTASVASHAILHIASLYQEQYSLSTLDLGEFEALCNGFDKRVLEWSDRIQSSIPVIDMLSAQECYRGVLAMRDAIGKELGIDMKLHLRFASQEGGIYE